MGGRPAATETYPPMLVKRILLGLRKQLKEDKKAYKGDVGTVVCEQNENHWDEKNQT